MGALNVLLITSRSRLAERLEKAVVMVGAPSTSARTSVDEATGVLETSIFDLAVIDLTTDSARATALARDLRAAFPDLSLLVVTDKNLRDHDREAIELGVDGFIVQPVHPEHVYFQLLRARELRRLREDYARLREESKYTTSFEGLVGSSHRMKELFHLVSRAAATIVPVAVYGESGTGKEIVARAIHRLSGRDEGSMISVNPAAIPETLLESELFGYVAGAFTGAGRERKGLFEAAHGGTLFLDEIGELPLAMQVKLLRVLQTKTVQRVGSTEAIPVDFRLITATHRDLMEEVRAGRFREDLFYRIHVLPIYVPPLRLRGGDIALLAEHFLRSYARENGRTIGGFAPGVLDRLMQHSWPGNVRELENAIQRVVALKTHGARVELADLEGLIEASPLAARSSTPHLALEIKPLAQHVHEYVTWVCHATNENKARAARLLEIDRATLYRKLKAPSRSGT